jgi:sugar lactone lactonase YvrE
VIDTSTTGVSTLAGNGTGEIEDGVHTGASVYDPYVQGVIGSTLYFGEGYGDVIRSVDVDTKEVTTLAGSPDMGYFNDGAGVGALCSSPASATTDGEYLYFTESGSSHLIRKMNLDTREVSHVSGIYGFDGKVDNYQDSQFRSPGGITTDGDNLYVADTGNHTIRKIVLATGHVSTLAGTAESNGSDDGTGSAARFFFPTGITTDGTNLYVTDRNNNTIRQIVISTKVVTTLAGDAADSPDWVDGTGADARFNNPYGITTDGTSLFVADRWNQRIRKIDIATAEVTTLAGDGNGGAVDGVGTTAQFNGPYGIACDGTYLYVTEEQNDMVRRIDIATTAVTSIAGHPSHTDEWADGTYMDAYFYDPTGAVCDGQNLWIMDRGNHVIRRVQ